MIESAQYDDDRRIVTHKAEVDAWTIPAGFVWDGASIPRLGWSVVGSPFTGHYQRAALVHDLLYTARGKLHPSLGPSVSHRKAADRIFLRLMAADGVSAWKRRVMYWAVRVGGQKAWDSGDGRVKVHRLPE